MKWYIYLFLFFLCLLIPNILVAHPDHVNNDQSYREGDEVLDRMNVIIDAPWRIEKNSLEDPYIPVMVHFPEKKKNWDLVEITKIVVINLSEKTQKKPIFIDEYNKTPLCFDVADTKCESSKLSVIDAFGKTSRNLDLLKAGEAALDPNHIFKLTDENRGWHIFVRIPLSLFEANIRKVALRVEVYYNWVKDEKTKLPFSMAKNLYTDLDENPLPCWDSWQYYDAHTHTIAEYSTDTGFLSVRKDFGGPLQMYKEMNYLMGIIRNQNSFKNNVISTDHNNFFSDKDVVKIGPSAIPAGEITLSHPELRPYFVDDKGNYIKEGQKEYENYMDFYGITMGEEVSLTKDHPNWIYFPITLTSHLLTYSTRHFMGPFHSGKFIFFPNEKNNNTLDRVLLDMAITPDFKKGFSYAAHPFSKSGFMKNFGLAFTDSQIDTAVNGEFIRKANDQNMDFIFKGFQVWNGKKTAGFNHNTNPGVLKVLEDPTVEEKWKEGDSVWDKEVNYDLFKWHENIVKAMRYSIKKAPNIIFIRKLFGVGGTDAHGDFNRTSSALARPLTALPRLLKYLPLVSINDNAYSKVRTFVNSEATANEPPIEKSKKALFALSKGHGIITDGPVGDFTIDADAHFNSDTLEWHAEESFENMDGKMGGSGRMDGGRTMLVTKQNQNILFAHKWKNTPYFGGDVVKIELYKDDLKKMPEMKIVKRGKKSIEVLKNIGELNPTTTNNNDGWNVSSIHDILSPKSENLAITDISVYSIGGFTKWENKPPFNFRFYSNPIWVIAAELHPSLNKPSFYERFIKPGDLKVTFNFPVSMSPEVYDIYLCPLNEAGNSTGRFYRLSPLPTNDENQVENYNGWNVDGDILFSEFTVFNKSPIDRESSAKSDQFIVVFKNPNDIHGNELNSFAQPVDIKKAIK